MKSAKKKSKSRIKAEPSHFYPKSPESLIGGAGEIEEIDKGKQALDWLTSAFPRISFEQIDSAHQEAGGDAFVAAGILGAELVDPVENPRPSVKKSCARKQKRVAASTGMISGVIGKDYAKSPAACKGGRRGLGDPLEAKGREVCVYSMEEAEDFLCSMLASDSELSMSVTRDVLSHCGDDLGKALDKLLDISELSRNQFKDIIGVDHIKFVSCKHRKGGMRNSEIHGDMLNMEPPRNSYSFQIHSFHFRDYLEVPLRMEDQVPLQSATVNPDLQQMVLESLFNNSGGSYVGHDIWWKKAVKRVESFGQGLRFSFEGSAESLSESRSGDGYRVFRSVSEKNWNTMRSYYQKAAQAYSNGERVHASYLSEKGRSYKKLAQEADEKASQEIFESRNNGIRNTVTIDLHGQHVKHAVRLVKLHLLLFAYIPSVQFLRVITGCGADGLGLGKLKRMVLDLVQKECIKYNEENSGTLLLSVGSRRTFSFMESEIDSDEI